MAVRQSRNYLGPNQYRIFYVDRMAQKPTLYLRAVAGDILTYKVGIGETPLRFADASGAFTALTGTVTLTNGSLTVVGAGTAFTTELVVGDIVSLDNGKLLLEVAAIGSNTSMTLTAVWTGLTVAGETLNLVTMASQTIGSQGTDRFPLPADPPGGVPFLERKYLYVELVGGGQLQLDYMADDLADFRVVRDSLTEPTLA